MIGKFFNHLGSIELLTDTEADKIALLYVYFPLIHDEIYNFVGLWNNDRMH